jgi:hypothetical protein
VNGANGTSGTSGVNGTSGTSGVNGTSGTSGINGTSGTSGINGTSGTTGTSGSSGTRGTSGTSGVNGANGSSGTSGINGTSGTSGTTGTSGTSGVGTTWNEITGTSATIAVNNGYVANNAALVTLTLPGTAAFGTIIEVASKGAGGWRISQNALQSIKFGNISTTVGTFGYLQSVAGIHDSIRILCITANTTWTVLSVQGNITVI